MQFHSNSSAPAVRLRLAMIALTCILLGTPVSWGQLAASDITALQDEAPAQGWTFDVTDNDATPLPLDALCGLTPPKSGPPDPPLLGDPPLGVLPDAFDWRTEAGCPPVRDQATCGGCWAFATLGALECSVLIKDGDTVDLAEQWLINCNAYGYSCDGGWFAPQHLLNVNDGCGEVGAVLEADEPYVAANGACDCPYDRAYTIDAWSYVAGQSSIPTVEQLKQAIYDYGPVAVAVHVDATFQAYGGGVFNNDVDSTVNHGVVLVGWDDNDGAAGAWILRNSWGSGWGESGYMRIEYGCSRVGYGACYVDYPGTDDSIIQVTPASIDLGEVAVGDFDTANLTVKNVGTDTLDGSATGLSAPLSIDGAATYSLAPGASTTITVRFEPELLGDYEQTLEFSGGGGAEVTVTAVASGSGLPSDNCAGAPSIGAESVTADTTVAQTSTTASCGGGGGKDVWWLFEPPFTGRATIDTEGSDFDTVLSIYAACGSDEELDCHDDVDGDSWSEIVIDVQAYQSYPIRVAGVAGASGNAMLNVSIERPDLVIEGRVYDQSGDPVADVVLEGLPDSPVTDADGRYAAVVPYAFSGTATPTLVGWQFDPPMRTYTSLIADRETDSYAGRQIMQVISGTVRDENGLVISGVVLSGLPDEVTTNLAGHYYTTVPRGFSGTVTPHHDYYTFTPTQRSYDTVAGDYLAEDFVGTLRRGSLAVTVGPAEAVAAGAAWRVNYGAWRASGEVVSELSMGAHVVDYAEVPGWSAPGHEVLTVNADQATSVTRTYVRVGYALDITVEPVDGGSVLVSPEPGSGGGYAADTPVTLTAAPAEGFAFGGWLGIGDGVVTEPTIEVVMNADRAVTATFVSADLVAGEVDALVSGAAPCGGGASCGGGMLLALPVTMLGVAGMKWRVRRQSRL